MDKQERVVLTKENFGKYFQLSTGLTYFINPFDLEGEKREEQKNIAKYYLTRHFSGPGNIFGWHDNPFGFAEDGEFSDMINALFKEEDSYFTSNQILELEDDEEGTFYFCLEDDENSFIFIE